MKDDTDSLPQGLFEGTAVNFFLSFKITKEKNVLIFRFEDIFVVW